MNAEVIIVGGGIIGCAAAYNLATAAAFASPAVTPENCRW